MRLAYLIAFSLFVSLATARAGAVRVPSDIEVRFTAEPTTQLVPGEPIYATLAVTNLGPSAVDTLAVESSIYVDAFAVRALDCHALFPIVFDTDTGYFYVLSWQVAGTISGEVDRLAVGQTLTCNLTLTLTRNAPPVYDITFGLPYFYPDINASNDSATIHLQRAATPVPAAGVRAYGFLVACVAALGLHRRWRKRGYWTA